MVDLTGIPLAEASPGLLDFGSDLVPILGGPRQRLNRLGMRWSFAFTTPKMASVEARKWATRIARGKVEGAIVPIYEPDLAIGAAGSPNVASAVAGGTSVPVRGVTAGLVIPEGKWVSFIHGGRRYVKLVTATVTVSSTGTAMLGIFPMLRTPLAQSDIVEITQPKVEGLIDGNVGWPFDLDEVVQLSFAMAEAR